MYLKIIERYLNFLAKYGDEYTELSVMKELLRYSLCIGLGLQTKANDERVKGVAIECSEYILDDIDFSDFSLKAKQGLLEACIHTMELIVIKERGLVQY